MNHDSSKKLFSSLEILKFLEVVRIQGIPALELIQFNLEYIKLPS